ncbi:copper resistance CopC/CopD family protein [Streptomyces sp. NBRC 110028]|uniref:copper resistance CopC/CopD family protein n=1 Tax=Streptomyces sp. NBRC 110028 TaxID=1621260 RepID=UPI00099EDD67|nr:copper resistance protein CopC [Streptomyces sp. NBRC 110028]
MPSLTSPTARPRSDAPTGARASVAARRLLSVLGALFAALLCALSFGAGPASAHAALTSTSPGEGAVVKSAPSDVTLTFSEGVLLGRDALRVLDPKGKRVDAGKAAHTGGKSSTASVALRSGLADGTYTVAWKATSEDSHPVSGAFTFSIGAPSKTSVAAPTGGSGDSTVTTLYGIGRYAAYGGFAALVGACVFAGLCRSSRPVRKIAVGGWATLFGSTVLLLLLRAPYANSEGIGKVLDLGGLGDALDTKPGAALVSRLLLLGVAAVFLAVLFGSYTRHTEAAEDDAKRRQDLAFGLGFGGVVVAVGLASTWAMAEHASVGIQRQLAMPVDVIHLVAVGVWVGGLASLAVTLRAGVPIERAAVARFSRLAFGSVIALVLTGLYQSWRQVGSWKALTGTDYGRVLLVKVGLVAVLVGIAAVSRRWTARLSDATASADVPADASAEAEDEAKAVVKAGQPVRTGGAGAGEGSDGGSDGDAGTNDDPVRSAQLARQRAAKDKTAARRERDADPQRSGLRRSVIAETVVAAVLLAVTTVLSGTQPGRAETGKPPAAAAVDPAGPNVDPVSVEIPYNTGPKSGRGKAIVMLDPALPGDNALNVFISDFADRPIDVPEVKVALTLKQKGLGPLSIPLKHRSTGHWSAQGVQLPMPGKWLLSLTVRTSDIDQVTETRNVKIAQ